MQLVLASQSPRRRELLKQLGLDFKICPADIDESVLTQESAQDYVKRLALQKAKSVWQESDKALPVLGSDTVCVLDNEILTKPRDLADSQRMLSQMSANVHLVLTSVALVFADKQVVQVIATEVEFAEMSKADINAYWHTGEPQDKAGSYAIQGLGGQFVKRINGSYSAVVGLPLYETSQMLKQFGIKSL